VALSTFQVGGPERVRLVDAFGYQRIFVTRHKDGVREGSAREPVLSKAVLGFAAVPLQGFPLTVGNGSQRVGLELRSNSKFAAP
jgi:hypothetical protein